MRLSSLSTVYVKAAIASPHDPTGDIVQAAFTLAGDPSEDDWREASWAVEGLRTYARCLVGPDGTGVLEKGENQMWLRITDSPEIPVLVPGSVSVF